MDVYAINSSCSGKTYCNNVSVKNVWRLTAFVTFLWVAVTGLHRGALTLAVDAVAGAAALLDATAASHRTLGPLRPGGPAVFCVIACCKGRGGINDWAWGLVSLLESHRGRKSD